MEDDKQGFVVLPGAEEPNTSGSPRPGAEHVHMSHQLRQWLRTDEPDGALPNQFRPLGLGWRSVGWAMLSFRWLSYINKGMSTVPKSQKTHDRMIEEMHAVGTIAALFFGAAIAQANVVPDTAPAIAKGHMSNTTIYALQGAAVTASFTGAVSLLFFCIMVFTVVVPLLQATREEVAHVSVLRFMEYKDGLMLTVLFYFFLLGSWSLLLSLLLSTWLLYPFSTALCCVGVCTFLFLSATWWCTTAWKLLDPVSAHHLWVLGDDETSRNAVASAGHITELMHHDHMDANCQIISSGGAISTLPVRQWDVATMSRWVQSVVKTDVGADVARHVEAESVNGSLALELLRTDWDAMGASGLDGARIMHALEKCAEVHSGSGGSVKSRKRTRGSLGM